MFRHVRRDSGHVAFQSVCAPLDAVIKPEVSGSCFAYRRRANASACSVVLQGGEKCLWICHTSDGAIWPRSSQVPIGLLIGQLIKKMMRVMESDFRHALLWHMERHGTRPADLSRQAGVSLDIIKKLRGRENSSTNAETAGKIAAYYGKNLQQFLRLEDPQGDENTFIALVQLLTPDERAILERQVRGMIAGRS